MDFIFPEGATPIADASDLLISWVQTMSDLNRVEAENISHAQHKYLRPSSQNISAWFHYAGLHDIHRSMFGSVWGWAGKARKSVTSIGVAPGLIASHIAMLCEEVISWSTVPVELTFLEKSARIHHRLVQIHPFENGNGRFSRLVADRCLLAWKCPHPFWPDNLQYEGEARKKYIQTLKAADRGNYDPLIRFMKDLGATDPSLSNLLQDNFYKPFIESSRGIAKIRALLKSGENPNHISRSGHYPLHLIVKGKLDTSRKLEFLRLLIDSGAKIDLVDKNGLTPFQVAAALGNKEIAFFLKSFTSE